MRDATGSLGKIGVLLGGGLLAFAGCQSDGFWCGGSTCGDSKTETSALLSLADLPAEVPEDPTNAYAKNPGAIALGKQFFFDTRFSGPVTGLDSIGRPVPFGRAAKGQPAGVACATCHDFSRGSIDTAAAPGNVSVGASWTFTNALPIFNAGFYQLITWNGRVDSLWAQAAADNENWLTTNGNRLATAWAIADLYRAPYEKVFEQYPLPMQGKSSDWKDLVIEPGTPQAGQCKLVGGACPEACRWATSTSGAKACFPHYPLRGKPGKIAGCQFDDATEPFWDAFDCMADDERPLATRVLINFGKAIASWEYTLVSRNSPFDRWASDLKNGKGDTSKAIPDLAKEGARLFVGKAACNECHTTPLFSDNRFHNIGVQQVGTGIPVEADCPAGDYYCDCAPPSEGHTGPWNCIPWGARDGIEKLKNSKQRRDSIWSDNPGDTSRMSFVSMDLDQVPKGAYRTPSLRNVALTAPYMHNGSMAKLEDVIWHYTQGGSSDTPGVRAPAIKPLFLTEHEQQALVSFLKSLTSDPIAPELVAPPVLPMP